jgi:8-oxo-dGTP pyrophosphatase MutT (NUDIX family)
MPKTIPFKREFSAGGVVYKKFGNSYKFLLGKHSGYQKWVLPKGLIEVGERSWQTALRETEEEMGVKAKIVLEEPLYKETYFYVADFKEQSQIPNSKFQIPNKSKISNVKISKQDRSTRRVMVYQEQGGGKVRVFKTVTFYLMEYQSGEPGKHGWEMAEAGWYDFNEALKMMAFNGEKEALKKAYKILTSV